MNLIKGFFEGCIVNITSVYLSLEKESSKIIKLVEVVNLVVQKSRSCATRTFSKRRSFSLELLKHCFNSLITPFTSYFLLLILFFYNSKFVTTTYIIIKNALAVFNIESNHHSAIIHYVIVDE